MQFGYCLPYLLLFVSWIGIAAGGVFVWLGAALVLCLLPLLEGFFPVRLRADSRPSLYFDALVWMALPVMVAFIGFCLLRSGTEQAPWEFFGIVVTAGLFSGILAINVGHELVHRRRKWERALGVGLLLLVNYAHYGIFHIFTHHRFVGTAKDPATARFGESFYAYALRHYTHGLTAAFKSERSRVEADPSGRRWNRVTLYFAIHFSAMALIYAALGGAALAFWLGQSLIAILLLIDVDYVEHYGLARAVSANGEPAALRPEHSWDSTSAWTNFLLFNLALHSHHHLQAGLTYPSLRAQDRARPLPHGYLVVLLAAFVPGLYRKLIHPRLAEIARPDLDRTTA